MSAISRQENCLSVAKSHRSLHSRISSFHKACAKAWLFSYFEAILLMRGNSTPGFNLYTKPFSRMLWDTAQIAKTGHVLYFFGLFFDFHKINCANPPKSCLRTGDDSQNKSQAEAKINTRQYVSWDTDDTKYFNQNIRVVCVFCIEKLSTVGCSFRYKLRRGLIVDRRQCRIVSAITQHLICATFIVSHYHIN